MKFVLDAIFRGIAYGFEKIPFLKKLQGFRSAIGFILIGLSYLADKLLELNGIGPYHIADMLSPYLIAFTGISLLAHDATPVGLK